MSRAWKTTLGISAGVACVCLALLSRELSNTWVCGWIAGGFAVFMLITIKDKLDDNP